MIFTLCNVILHGAYGVNSRAHAMNYESMNIRKMFTCTKYESMLERSKRRCVKSFEEDAQFVHIHAVLLKFTATNKVDVSLRLF